MFIYTPLLLFLSALSTTAMANPGVAPAQITPVPSTAPHITVSAEPTPYSSFCCAYNSIKNSDSVIETNYTLNLNGFGNTDASPAHVGTYPSTDLLCAPGLDTAINAAFKNEPGYKMTITCLPSYGATNDTYVALNMVVPTKDQGAALLDVVRAWAPSWASPKWDDPRTLVPNDATCPEDASLCQAQQLPVGYCLSSCG